MPLASALLEYRLGEIAGSSAVMSTEMEVEYFELELIIANLDKALEVVKLVLEEAGAPAGSEIHVTRDEREEVLFFGTKEGLAIYLDGIGLADEVYETCSCDGLAVLISGALSSVDGEIRGSWVGRSETAIYLYGPNAEIMFSTIKPILTTYPLCQNARIVIRHGNPELHPRTVRLPFHEDAGSVRQVFWGNAKGTG
jgi:hypothetical protein